MPERFTVIVADCSLKELYEPSAPVIQFDYLSAEEAATLENLATARGFVVIKWQSGEAENEQIQETASVSEEII